MAASLQPGLRHPCTEILLRKARVRYDEYDSELDSDPDEEAKRKAKQNQVAALMQDTNDLDDEVEKVLGHREMSEETLAKLSEEEREAVLAGNVWERREFHVKWKRYSYMHCTWETRLTVSQLAGYKRVLNYMKKMDDLERARELMTREERELQDVDRQMEEQLIQEHMQASAALRLLWP
eukprot:jgi/Astpho2/9534/Aster-x0402